MTHGLQFLDVREHFLRVDMSVLRTRMLADVRLSADERRQLDGLCEMAAARLHFEYHRNLERLKALYAPYDPDRDLPPPPQADVGTAGHRAAVGSAVEELLVAANYAEMPRGQVEACLAYDSRTGLRVKVHLADYNDLRVFYFQNLANNGSALAHLLDAAEAEKLKEFLLAYYLLYVERDRNHTAASLDRRVEEWLRAEFGVQSDFEVDDALADEHWPPMEAREIAPGVAVRRADMPHGPAATGGGAATKADIPPHRSAVAPFSERTKG